MKDYYVYILASKKNSNAIQREKNIKAWKRAWKLKLIDKFNPDWKDLYNKIV